MLKSKVMFRCFLILAVTVYETRPEAATRFKDREVIYPVSFGSTQRYMRFKETPLHPALVPSNNPSSRLAVSRPPSFPSGSFPKYSTAGTELQGLEFKDVQMVRNRSQKASVKTNPRRRVRNPNLSPKPKSKNKTLVDRADDYDDSFSLRNFLSSYLPSPIRSLLRSESEEEDEAKNVRTGPRPGMQIFRPQGLRSASENGGNIDEFDSIPTWHSPSSVISGHGQPPSFSQIESELSYETPSYFHPSQREVSYSSPLSFHSAEREVSYSRLPVFPPTQREIFYSSPYSFNPAERDESFHRPSSFSPEGGLISYSSSHSFPSIEREISHSSLMNFPTLQEEVSYSRPPSFSPANREISYSSTHSFPPIQREISYSGLQSYPPSRKEITYSSYPTYPPQRKEIRYSSYPSYPPVPEEISYSSLKPFPSTQKEISHPIYQDSDYLLNLDHDIHSDNPRSYINFVGPRYDHYPPRYSYSKPFSEGYTTLPNNPTYSSIMRSSRVRSDNSDQIDPHHESMSKMYKSSTNKRETNILHRPYSLRFVTPPPVYGNARYVSRTSGGFTPGHHMKSFGNSSLIVFPLSPHHPSSHLPLHPLPHVPTHPTSHHPPQPASHSPMHPPSNQPLHQPSNQPPHPPPPSALHSSPHPPFNPPSHNPPLHDRLTGESIRTQDPASPITFPDGSPDIIVTDDGFNISAATGNGICDLKNGQTMYTGTCSLLLSQGTCLENHWLVLLNNGISACAYRRCPHGMIFYDGSCVDPGDESVCGVGQMLYVHFTGEAECDCDPKHVYDPSLERCYGEHEQGFCRDSFYIEFRDNKAACVANPCHQEGFVMHDGRCYQKEYDGVCPGPQILFHPEKGTAECVEIATKSIYGVSIQTACPTGSKRSFLRLCRSVFRMPSQRTFPKQRGVCPSSFTGGSRNSCRQTVGLFG